MLEEETPASNKAMKAGGVLGSISQKKTACPLGGEHAGAHSHVQSIVGSVLGNVDSHVPQHLADVLVGDAIKDML